MNAVPIWRQESNIIVDTNRRSGRAWSFERHGATETITITGRFLVNSAKAAAKLAALGAGLAYVPRFAVEDALREGALVALLDQYEGAAVPLGAVYLEGRTLPGKVRALIDFAERDIRQAGFL